MSNPLLKSHEEGYSYKYYNPFYQQQYYTANDFDSAIQDIRLINKLYITEANHLSFIHDPHFTSNLNHFILFKEKYYFKNRNFFNCYLTFYLILKICKEQELSIKDIDKFYTDHMLSYLIKQGIEHTEKERILLFNNLKIVKKIVNNFTTASFKYERVSTNTMVDFYCHGFNFKIHIPLVGYKKNNHVDIYYYGQHIGIRPNWYSVPSLFKIYDYFLDRGIIIDNFHYYSFDLENFKEPDLISIPYTQNVKELVHRYRNIAPYPFPNIFKLDDTRRCLKSVGAILNESTL